MNKLGKVSLVLSLFCFLITLGLKLAISDWMPFFSVGLGFGLFFFVFSVAINFKYFRGVVHSESLQFVVKSLVTVGLALGLLMVSNFIIFKQGWSFDITSNKMHSLSGLTQALVKAIPEEVTFYYFHVDNQQVQGFEKRVREEVQRYQALNSKLHFKSYSVFQRPDLAKKFGIGDEESSLFIEYKGRTERVADLQEAAITNAFLKLTKDPKKIYFLENNDARSINDESTFGLSGLKMQLERLHYKIDRLDNLDQLPADMALLALVGPRKRLDDADFTKLRNYLEKGGSLLIAADPGEDHNLNPFLKDYQIELKNHFMFSDQAQAGQSKLLVLGHPGQDHHEITRTLLEGQNPILFIASSVEIVPLDNPSQQISPILQHLPTTVGRKDIDVKSEVVTQGPQIAAVLSEGTGDNRYRLLVVADSDFLTNQFNTQAGNFDFALSLFSYLTKDEDLMRMKSPQPQTTYLLLTQSQLNLYVVFFVLPFAGLFFVVALFLRLRRYF